jgi:integrase
MATIEKRRNQDGSITYRVKIRRTGYPTRTATFHRYADARAWAQREEATVQEQQYFPERASTQHTFGECFQRYRDAILPHCSHTLQLNRTIHLRWWDTQLGPLALAAVRPHHLTQAREVLRQQVGPATTNRYFTSLSAVCTVAQREWGWLATNPVHEITKLSEPRGRIRFLSEEERERLLAACQHSAVPHLLPLVVLAMSTGARRGELLKLTWPDVDFSRQRLTFYHTKNRTPRSVPLVHHALVVMQQWHTERGTAHGRVFVSGGQADLNFSKAWTTALRRAGIQNFRFHDLRHTCASYLAMSGASLLEIADVLGHKTLQMVQRYAHLTEQHTQSIVERMNRAVFGK